MRQMKYKFVVIVISHNLIQWVYDDDDNNNNNNKILPKKSK